MANAVRISASLDDKVSGPLGRIRDKMDTIGGKGTAASFLGNFAAGAVAAGIGAVAGAVGQVTDALGASIGKASDFNESLSKVGVVFGPSTKAIKDFAKTADVSLGLSETAALGFAGTFGNLFTNLKLGQPVAADMSKNIISLGGDLASFNNIETTDALDKLRAGLAGESEPLRALGVFLTEAKVKAEAMALGLAKGNEPLTEAAKVQARYSLILKETTLAQGDFARTSDGMANQTRINAARMENAWTRVGQGLLPIANTIMPLVADAMVMLVEGIGSVITGISKFVAENKGLISVLTTVAGIVGTVLGGAFGILSKAVGDAFAIVSDVLGAIFGVVQGVASSIIGVIRNIVGVAAEIPGPWQEGAKAVKATLTDMQTSVDGWGKSTATSAGKAADDIVANTTTGLASGAVMVEDAAEEGLADPISKAMQQAHDNVVKTASRTPQDIADALRDKRTAWQTAVDQLATDIENRMSTATEIAKLRGELIGENLTVGLRSKDPIVRAQAEATKKILTDRLSDLANDSTGYGWQLGDNYASGIRSKTSEVEAAARALSIPVARYLRLMSPAKEGPLSEGGGPEGWGSRLSTLFGTGMDRARGAVSGASSRLAEAATFSGTGSFGGGFSAAAPASFAAPSSGGNTLNVTIQTLTTPSAAQKQELERILTPIVVDGFRKRSLLGSPSGTY